MKKNMIAGIAIITVTTACFAVLLFDVFFYPHGNLTALFPLKYSLFLWIGSVLMAIVVMLSYVPESPGRGASVAVDTEEPWIKKAFEDFKGQWEAEFRLRQALLSGPDAPLRSVQSEYEATMRSAEKAFKSATAHAEAKRDAEYRACKEGRDAEYAAAERDRDAEYEAAKTARDKAYAKADAVGDRAAWSAAYHEYNRRWNAAYHEYNRRWNAAYNAEKERWNRAYNTEREQSSTAYRARKATEQAAAAKREEAARAYIAKHPEEVKKLLGEAYEGPAEQDASATYSSVQVLSGPLLVQTAREIVDGQRFAKKEQVAAVAANLRNYLSVSRDDDPDAELCGEARELLAKLIRRLN